MDDGYSIESFENGDMDLLGLKKSRKARDKNTFTAEEIIKNLMNFVKVSPRMLSNQTEENVPTIKNGKSECADTYEACCFWALMGECDLNPSYMETLCPQSCGKCGCYTTVEFSSAYNRRIGEGAYKESPH
uniref:ShKT domain-containing protein n=1 Tax=Acrobeloides nanus TaxID=290746 RepID=A0A914D794_9BILA